MSYASAEVRREVRRGSDRKRLGLKPWRPGGPGRPPKGRCVKCGGEPKAGLRRCETCLAKQRTWDKAHRERVKGGSVEPQCKPSSGPMRAEHDVDTDIGVCRACGKAVASFAPAPVETKPPEPLPKARPGKPGAHKPSRASRISFAGSPPAAPAAREKRIGDSTFAALLSGLERRRQQIDECIDALRKVEEWWPQS